MKKLKSDLNSGLKIKVNKKLVLPEQAEIRTFPLFKFSPGEGKKWYDLQYNDVSDSELSKSDVEKYENYADQLLENDVLVFAKNRDRSKNSDLKWLEQVGSSGTTTDRVASLTLLVQESPLHALNHLDTLLHRLNKKSRRESSLVVDTLKELFIEDLLPADRKLIAFNKRPLAKLDQLSSGNKDTRDRRLVMWRAEHLLKDKYKYFVNEIEQLGHDTVVATRTHSIKTMFQLLAQRPENEQFLLSSIVNKLGDSSYKVAAKTSNYLCKLMSQHPNMKPTVAKEVHALIYRPNISQRGQFYSVCTLSQVQLRSGLDMDLAVVLVNTYIGLFKLLIKGGQVDNRMLAVLLAGMKRAFPYTKGKTDVLLGELDTLYKVVGVTQLGTALQTLALLQHILIAGDGLSDRFYCAFYRKLWDNNLKWGIHHAQLFHLLYRTLKTDTVQIRVVAFLKRLLQLSLELCPSFACACLMLISELYKERPTLVRVEKKGEIKYSEKTQWNNLEGSDEEERFVDVGEDQREGGEIKNGDKVKKSGWIHRDTVKKRPAQTVYDCTNRNPLFSAADTTLAYELVLLTNHSHPSVALFANNVLQGIPIEYSGDPLEDFTVIRFLDRFVFRNPKKSKKNEKLTHDKKTTSLLSCRRRAYNPRGAKGVNVTSEEYARMEEAQIPVDERFMHTYIQHTGVKNRRGDEVVDSGGESVDSDEFDQLIEKFEPGQSNDNFMMDFERVYDGKRKVSNKRKKIVSDDSESCHSENEVNGLEDTAQQFGDLLETVKRPDQEKKKKHRRIYNNAKKNKKK